MKLVTITDTIRDKLLQDFNKHGEFPVFADFAKEVYKCELVFVSDEYWPSFLSFNQEKDHTWFLMNMPME